MFLSVLIHIEVFILSIYGCRFPLSTVRTFNGPVTGSVKTSELGNPFFAFTKIPYAKAPVDDLRFKDPEPYPDWFIPLDATEDSPACIQLDMFDMFNLHGVEDCLYLNVYTKQIPTGLEASKYYPVMVWIHGGAFFSGSGNYTTYGPQRIIDYDVILVTINYRLGPLGFLSTGDSVVPGNMGLKDQVMALKWVQKNIAAFGGDPDRVTIFGESAGAVSAHLMQISPLAKGLFHGLIAQSGSFLNQFSNVRNPVPTTKEYATANGCEGENSEEIIQCLRGKDASQLASMTMAVKKWSVHPFISFGPVVEPAGSENAFLTRPPKVSFNNGEYTHVPIIMGVNEQEGAFFAGALLDDPSVPAYISANPDKTIPYLLFYYDRTDKSDYMTEKIMEFYFPNGNVSHETGENIAKMTGDRYLYHCIATAVKKLMKETPVYMYKFNYKARQTFVQFYTKKDYDFGASHFDEIQYLFPSAYFPLEQNEDEKEMSHTLLTLWTNFAKTGNPNSPPEESQWLPVDSAENITFLDLQLDRTEMSTFDVDMQQRLKFWDEIWENDDMD